MKAIVRSFKRFKFCAYCGQPLAWRWVWDVNLCIVHTGEGVGIALDLWPVHWRRLIDGACPCTPPANLRSAYEAVVEAGSDVAYLDFQRYLLEKN